MPRLRDLKPIERDELGRALRVLLDESIGDFVYQIREREGLGWDGPRVKAYSDACEAVRRYAPDPDPEVVERREALARRRQELEQERERVEEEIRSLGGRP